MGKTSQKQTEQIIYSLPIKGSAKDGCSEIYRNPIVLESDLISNMSVKLNNCWDMIETGLKSSCNGEFLGSRKKLHDGTFGEYEFMRYSEIIQLAKEFGSGILNMGGLIEAKYDDKIIKKLNALVVFGKNCINWSITEYACSAYNITLIPLYDVFSDDSLIYILSITKPSTIVCTNHCAKRLTSILEKITSVILVIIMDNDMEDLRILDKTCVEVDKENTNSTKVKVVSFNQVLTSGKNNLQEIKPGNIEDINSIHFTSGTTGNPKGVILPNRCWIACLAGVLNGQFGHGNHKVTSADIHISYLPLAHIFERIVHMVLAYLGGKIGFYNGDVQKLVGDLQALKPTVFVTAPRLLNRIYDKIFSGLEEKNFLSQWIFKFALECKSNSNNYKHLLWDTIVFNKLKNLLGGNVRAILSGAAPLQPSVQSKLRTILCAPCFQGFGMTELLAAFIPEIIDPSLNTIGGPTPSYEFKLKPVSEMGYSPKNNPPSGELLVRGAGAFSGYFCNEEETNKVIDKDGWFCTGDIVELNPNGNIRLIDRGKNIFKLAQGEYIAPEKLESIYCSNCELISQAVVVGNSFQSYIVALFVLDEEFTYSFAKHHSLDHLSLKELSKHPVIINKVFQDIQNIEKDYKFAGYEKIKTFKLLYDQFSIENGLLTPTFKIIRHKVIKEYDDTIKKMYETQSI